MPEWLPPVLDTIYRLAAALALVGAVVPPRNRVAWPLLASFVFYQVAVWQEWEYDAELWATVDIAVLILITGVLLNEWRKNRLWLPNWSDFAVLALFVPIIIAYALRHNGFEAAAHIVSMAAGIAQLLVVFPLRAAWVLLAKASSDMADKDDFDLMARA